MDASDAKTTKELERRIKSPKKPTTIETARDLRFPGVIMQGEEHIEQAKHLSKHSGVKKGVFYNQAYSHGIEKDFARWSDHRSLLRQKASPKRMPGDVPKHIMDAVEDMRAGRLVEQTGLKYNCSSYAAEIFFEEYGYGDRLLSEYEPSHEVWGNDEIHSQTLREEVVAKRLAQETMGILTTLPYLFSPAREIVEKRVENSFHPRMKYIVQAVTKMMRESDLSFADAHHIGRLLNQMLADLPAPEQSLTSPPLPTPTGGSSSGDGEEASVSSKGLDKEKKVKLGKEKGAGDQKVGWSKENSVDWGKYQSAPRTYSPEVRRQLAQVGHRVHAAFDYIRSGRSYGNHGYFTPRQVERTRQQLGKDKRSKNRDKGVTTWCSMTIETPKLTQQKVRPNEVGRGYRHIASESGRVPRNMHRFATDQRVFSTKRHRKGGIALLCDVSGSMHVSVTDIDRVLEMVPASIIALHSGTSGIGKLRVVAKDGRRVTESKMKAGMGGGNGVDLPALQWLARQKCGGKYWLSDGAVTGRQQRIGWQLLKDCDDFCVKHDIYQVETIEDLFDVIFEGKPLKKRTMAKWAQDWFGQAW